MERLGFDQGRRFFKKRIKHFLVSLLTLVFLFRCGDVPSKLENRDVKIPEVLKTIDGGNIRYTIQHLQSLKNRTTWEEQNEAALWAYEKLENIGLDLSMHRYEWEGKAWPNIIAEIKGKDQPEDIIMAIAHIDSKSSDIEVGAPGADDDATGVAVLIEAAKILKEISLQRTVMLCIFSNEDRGCIGSKTFARQARNDGLKIEAVINLDILGYNRPSSPFYLSAVQTQRINKEKIKSSGKMILNYILGVIEGKDIVKIAGRVKDQELVRLTSEVVRKSTSLRVKEIISNDCG